MQQQDVVPDFMLFLPVAMTSLHVSQANWYKAAQYCRFHGMNLAAIESERENRVLESHIQDAGENN